MEITNGQPGIGDQDRSFGVWKALYTDGAGNIQELALGSDNEVYTSTGATTAPDFE